MQVKNLASSYIQSLNTVTSACEPLTSPVHYLESRTMIWAVVVPLTPLLYITTNFHARARTWLVNIQSLTTETSASEPEGLHENWVKLERDRVVLVLERD